MLPRDAAVEAAWKFVHAMQYYWLFGLADARVSRREDADGLLIDAIALDQNVLKVAARPPTGLEVEQVHLLWSHQELVRLSDGEWEVAFGRMKPGSTFWGDKVANFKPAEGDRLVLCGDGLGFGSPFRCLSSSDPAMRPEMLPYVPAHSIKGLKPARFSLWRWQIATFAAARIFEEWPAVVPPVIDKCLELDEADARLHRAGTEIVSHLRALGVSVAQEIAGAIGREVIYLPWRWQHDEASPRGLWQGSYDGVFVARPGDGSCHESDRAAAQIAGESAIRDFFAGSGLFERRQDE